MPVWRAAGVDCDPVNEFELIREYFDRAVSQRAELGIGDDAAVIAVGDNSVAITTDMLVCGRHFTPDADPVGIGYKSLAVNLSDLAAMGARPTAFTMAIALPEPDAVWLRAFSQGLFEAADEFDCELIGGDTTRGPLTISITAFGVVPPGAAIRRDQAQPGDDVWVSGQLGGAAATLQARQSGLTGIDPALQRRLDKPSPRIELSQRLAHIASATIDISDGLLADLGHIADRSRLAITICSDDLPLYPGIDALNLAQSALVLALTGGDDYELAFTSAPENRSGIERLAGQLDLSLTCIGSAHAGQGVHVQNRAGHPMTNLPTPGYDHFGQ